MDQTQQLPAVKQSLVTKFATKYSIEPDKLMSILKATAFKVATGEVSNEQMAALLVVADQYGLNPFTREIFAFEDKYKGIVPVVSVDGWARIINDHDQFDGLDFAVPEKSVTALHGGKQAFEWMECIIYRKDRSHPIRVREYLEEVYQNPRGQNQTNGPWQSHPRRMHRHKAMIQCARLAFGFAGIYDEDEAERIIQGQTIEGTATRTTEKSATARMAAALNPSDPNKQPDKQPDAPKDTQQEPDTLVSLGGLIEVMDATVESQMSVLNRISAMQDENDRKTLMKLWNDAVRKLKGLAPEPAAQTQQQPAGDQPQGLEKGSGQRLGSIKLKLAECKTIDDMAVIVDSCRLYEWTPDQQKQLDEAAQAASERLAQTGQE